jgi:hypothetical protein
MTIVIADALPPSTTVHALSEPFAARYPKTIHWFNARAAHVEHWSVAEHGCTPIEGWQLTQMGFKPAHDSTVGAGLAPWLARTLTGSAPPQKTPVWIATLCSTVISQERATALPLSLLNVSSAEIDALSQTVAPLMTNAGDGIELVALDDGVWQVSGPLPVCARTITPMALMGQDLGDWWPMGDHWRAWRKRVNEIQMAWHDHPVNLARERQGLPAVNSIWLFGGAAPFEVNDAAGLTMSDTLARLALEADWARWLDAWAEVEPLLLSADPDETVVLSGPDCLVHLTHAPARWWGNLFANKQKHAWRDWWINRK